MFSGFSVSRFEWTVDNGAWKEQLKDMEKSVEAFCRKIIANKLDIIMAVHMVNTVLIPRLELGAKFASPSDKKLEEWNGKIIRAILKIGGDSCSAQTFLLRLQSYCRADTCGRCDDLCQDHGSHQPVELAWTD